MYPWGLGSTTCISIVVVFCSGFNLLQIEVSLMGVKTTFISVNIRTGVYRLLLGILLV